MSVPSDGVLPDLIRLDRSVLLVGRDPAADVRLPHPGVSRRHAELRPDGGGVLVRDLRSRAGVFINRVAVASGRIDADDVVGFGPVSYELKGGCLRLVTRTDGVAVVARGLTVRRGDRTVLESVNLSVPANNFVGILGPSGAGKTTLLKGLTGFLRASAGQVFFDGLNLAAHREACRAMVGFVPQEDVVYAALTARENLDFALRLRVARDLRPEERAAWVESALKRLGLENDADRPVRTLSGGQRKRVSVAVELLSRPRLLFLDEPTAGLDPAAEGRLMGFLRDLARRGTTVVCTTHVMESLDLFDAVVVVARGRVRGSGDPNNLLKHFNVQCYAELYEELEKPPPAPIGGLPPPAPPPPPTRPSRPARPVAGVLNQIAVQFLRGLLVIARDRTLVALLVGQPLLIAFLICLSQYWPGPATRANLFYTFAVVASIWFGLNNTAREVVRDRVIYVRERRTMLSPESYLLAKVAQFACIGLAQVVLLSLWLRYCNFMPAKSDAYKDLQHLSLGLFVLVLWLTYLSAMLLGLLISTLAQTEEVAVAVLPLVVLPQLLLSGVAADMNNLPAGRFDSLPVMVALVREREAQQDARPPDASPVADWGLVSASLLTYSRPALVFFLYYANDKPDVPPDPWWKSLIDWGHLLFLLLATATAFVAVFLRCERRWLEAS